MSIKEVVEILRLPLNRIEELIRCERLVAKESVTGSCDISEASLVKFLNTYGPSDWCWSE